MQNTFDEFITRLSLLLTKFQRAPVTGNELRSLWNMPTGSMYRAVDGYVEAGWLREVRRLGNRGLSYVLVAVPTVDDLNKGQSPGQSGFAPDEAFLVFSASPRSTDEIIDAFEVSTATASKHVRLHVAKGCLFFAGKRRSPKGPPAQLYCSDKEAARKSIIRWIRESRSL